MTLTKKTHYRKLRHRVFDRVRRGKFYLSWLGSEAARLAGGGTNDAVTFTNATNTVNHAAHGYVDGDGPIQLTTDTTLPAELAVATDYWVIVTAAGTYQLAESKALALLGTVFEFTDDGSGTHGSELHADSESMFDFHKGPPPVRPETIEATTDIDDL